ncbi:MarR family winged helix-turn-helix transcriptional regulator [Streptomyces sp. NPDC090306]|uniref:MarR family winged helix-turn-helix transcriptional regulator n=1 Tax=unclassified Streptomyces TaxID=2593676 RepID=UPI0036E78B17
MTANEELAERLRVSVGRFVRATRSHTDALPLPHSLALGFLDREGDLSIAALADRRGVRHQSMSRTIVELEELRYVERRRNPADGRGFLFTITPGGVGALEQDRQARRRWVAAGIADVLDDHERAQLEALPDLLNRLSAYSPED